MSDLGHEAESIRKTTNRGPDTALDASPTHDNNPLTRLQRMIGNRAVQRLVTSDGQAIQTKLTVTAANDAYENEADAVAEQVVQKMHASPVQREGDEEELQAKRIQRETEEDELQTMRIQREADEDELQTMRIQRDMEGGETEDEELQAKRIQRNSGDDMMGSFAVDNEFEKNLNSARGGGQAIDASTRGSMENAMGADFSNVRIHQGDQADSLSSSIQAKAFTTGSDIFFKSGQYNPGSTDGQKLLAHELTHTIQQGAVSTKRDETKS